MVVIKLGGAMIESPQMDSIWEGVKLRCENGESVVVVHGGGPQTTALAKRLGHEPRIIQGRRVTTATDLEILLWILRGELNARFTAQAHAHQVAAIGLSGSDFVSCTKRPLWEIEGEMIDFGFVGDVTNVDGKALQNMVALGRVPVIAALGMDTNGQLFNINADTVAVAIAEALNADELLLLTETGGLLRDFTNPNTAVSQMSEADFQAGKAEGWIAGGMLVKCQLALNALKKGVKKVYISKSVASPESGTLVKL